MFEDALLDSSPRHTSVLRRIHYLFSTLTGTLFFVQAVYLLPLLLAPASLRALIVAAAMAGVAAALCALMLCYVWADTRQQHLAHLAVAGDHTVAEPAGLSDLPRLLRPENRRLETRGHSAGVCCRVDARRRIDSRSADLHSGIAKAVAHY